MRSRQRAPERATLILAGTTTGGAGVLSVPRAGYSPSFHSPPLPPYGKEPNPPHQPRSMGSAGGMLGLEGAHSVGRLGRECWGDISPLPSLHMPYPWGGAPRRMQRYPAGSKPPPAGAAPLNIA